MEEEELKDDVFSKGFGVDEDLDEPLEPPMGSDDMDFGDDDPDRDH